MLKSDSKAHAQFIRNALKHERRASRTSKSWNRKQKNIRGSWPISGNWYSTSRMGSMKKIRQTLRLHSPMRPGIASLYSVATTHGSVKSDRSSQRCASLTGKLHPMQTWFAMPMWFGFKPTVWLTSTTTRLSILFASTISQSGILPMPAQRSAPSRLCWRIRKGWEARESILALLWKSHSCPETIAIRSWFFRHDLLY